MAAVSCEIIVSGQRRLASSRMFAIVISRIYTEFSPVASPSLYPTHRSTRAEFSMMNWLTQLDRLLRGDVTRAEELREGKLEINASGMAVLIVVLGMIYGLGMGSDSLMKEVPQT